jgi:hypothetical protein
MFKLYIIGLAMLKMWPFIALFFTAIFLGGDPELRRDR